MKLVLVIVIMVTLVNSLPDERLTTLTATSSLQEVNSEILSVARKIPPDEIPGMKPSDVMSHEEALKLNLKMLAVRRIVQHSRVIPEDDRNEKVAEINTILAQLKAF